MPKHFYYRVTITENFQTYFEEYLKKNGLKFQITKEGITAPLIISDSFPSRRDD